MLNADVFEVAVGLYEALENMAAAIEISKAGSDGRSYLKCAANADQNVGKS